MKKIFCTFFLNVSSLLLFGQANQKLNHIFYDLPIDSSRSIIYDQLKDDKRFKEILNGDTLDIGNEIMKTYRGKVLNNGTIKSNPDSGEIGLTFGYFSSSSNHHPKENISYPISIIHLEYYFSEIKVITKEYESILAFVRKLGLDSNSKEYPKWGAAKNANGIEYLLNRKKKSKIEILIKTYNEHKYGLFIEYTKESN